METQTPWNETERRLWLVLADNALQLVDNALNLGAPVAGRLANYDVAITEVCR